MMKQIIIDNQVTPYYITDKGECYNSKTDNYLKGQISNSGYRNYNLSITPNDKKRFYAHRLVAQFFLNGGLPIPKGYEVNHIDCDKMNNMLDNLEIITCKQNTQHAVSNKRKKYKIVYQYNDKLQIINTFYNICDAVSTTGINRSKIVANLGAKKPSLTSEGHYWSYNNQLTFSDISVATNQGISKKVAQYTLDGVFVREYSSCGEAKRINFPNMKRGTGHISECCRGKIKQYKGYVWKYKDDIV